MYLSPLNRSGHRMVPVDLAAGVVAAAVAVTGAVIGVAVEGRCSAVVLREALAEAVRAVLVAASVVLPAVLVVPPADLVAADLVVLRAASAAVDLVVLRAEVVHGVAAAAVIGAVDLVR